MRRLSDKQLLQVEVSADDFEAIRAEKPKAWRGWLAPLAIRRKIAEEQLKSDLRGLED